MQLQDSVIIITGGGQGLGRAMGEFLAAKGAKLALVDLNQEALDAAVAACKAAGGDARQAFVDHRFPPELGSFGA